MFRKKNLLNRAIACFVILSLSTVLVQFSPKAGSTQKSVRLAVITSPVGTGEASQIADALIPQGKVVGLQLVPLKDLMKQQISPSSLDAGVDAGVTDPYETTSEQALEAALAFKLSEAAQLWREVADTALSSETVAYEPVRVATFMMEAGAASAAAGEKDLAIAYFQNALSIKEDIQPGVEISPDAQTLFEDARARGPARFFIPRDAILQDICEQSSVNGLVWIAVSGDKNTRIVSFKLFLKGGESSELETRHHVLKGEKNSQWVSKEQARFSQMLALKLFGSPETTLKPKDKEVNLKPSKPWYKKWWFYTLVGTIVIGGGAAGLATYFATRPDHADAEVYY